MPRRKIPTKAELIQLQKLYRTDEKIAERLGNVNPQLVAYWRRKKNIPRHLFPKFTDSEIRELWERYGDDYRCGLELGISKAAFYNWRRKYGFKQKPAFLKLEQLELNLGGPGRSSSKKRGLGRQTISQKILAERTGKDAVEVDEMINAEPDLAVTHANTGLIIEKFREFGLSYVWNPNRIAVQLDHSSPADSSAAAEAHKIVREFARRQNIKYFHDIHEGAGHQVIIERGLILPGQLALGTDSNMASYGCIGAFASSIDTTEMAALWAMGRIWLRVPATIKIIINGRLPRGVYARDVILFIAGKFGCQSADYKAIEFYGSTISQMSISERFTITGFSAGLGAKAALCPFDSITRRFMLGRTKMPFRPMLADRDSHYENSYEFNVERLVPQIARPHSIDNVSAVAEIAGLPVNQVIIGSCANGRFDDLRTAADIVKGKRIHRDIRMLVFPGSRTIYLEALKKGLVRAFIEAGAVVMNPGCGPCLGGHLGLLASGERCLATTNNNSRGCMGSEDAEVYIVSPATAAASALNGAITDPTGYVK
jgi:3-isopropylmalate/(R)-2-methylmalate dehydratase large subunit